jgi:hypothetical protein
MYKNIKVEAEHNELILENSNGDKVIIPANKRNWVKQKLSEGCHRCIDSLVETLPVAADYAGDGSLFPDWNTIKANHPTFSNESKYHNVDGNIGGSWMEKILFLHEKQMGDTPRYVAPDLLEVEITPEGTELKDQPKELESYYRDYAAQYPREAYIQFRKENPIGREKIKAINSKNWNDYIEKQANKEYKNRIRNYAGEQLLKANPQEDRYRKDYLNSFTPLELAVLRNSESKGKINPTLWHKFEGALKKGAAGGAAGGGYGTLQSDFLPSSRPRSAEKVETESLTDEEMKDVGVLDLLGPLSIPAKFVQAGYKDGYSFLDALKGQENNASLIEDILTDPLNLVGLGLVSKGASTAQLLKAYKNLSKLSNAERASTFQKAHELNPFAFKPKEGNIYRQVGKSGFDDAVKEGRIYDKGQKELLENYPDINYLDEYNEAINAKGLYLKKPSSAPFFAKDELFFPINRKATGKGNQKTKFSDAEYLFEGDVPNEALLPRYRDAYLSPEQSGRTFVLRPEYNDLSNFNVYKRDWLRGYKKIEVPTLNERLRNNPSYVINPEVRSTEKLAKELEPYLKSSTPPGSRQDEIVESFAPGLRQKRIERTTVNFNPDGSIITQEKAMGGYIDTNLPQDPSLLTSLKQSYFNPYNWGVSDYSDKGDFNTAYSTARKEGETEFMWNNKRYSTDIPKSNSINKFISDNVYPYGAWTTSESDFKIDYDELMQLRYHTDNKYTPDKKLHRDDIKKITRNDKGESVYDLYSSKGRSSAPGQPKNLNASYDALSIFNNQPQKYNSFEDSRYKPSDSKNPNAKYYRFNNKYEKQIEDDLLLYNNRDFIDNQEKKRQIEGSIIAGASLKDYQYSKGKDDRGDYIAYYDINDYGNILDIIPNTDPFEIYGRIHYKDYGDGKNKRMYYSDKELSELDANKKNFDTLALQRELSNRGYKLPKSTKEDGTFDGIWGDETKNALLEYRKSQDQNKSEK